MMHDKKSKMMAGGGRTKMMNSGGVKAYGMPMKTDPLLLVMAKAAWLKAGGMAKMAAGGGMMSKMKAGGGIKSKKAPSKMGAVKTSPKRDGVAKKGPTKGKMVVMKGR
jgi:hypothetical protein